MAYVTNLDKHELIGSHWIGLYVNGGNVTYFESFGVEQIPKEILKRIGSQKNITTNISRIQAYDSIMCGYFSIRFIDFVLKGRSSLEYTNLFLSNYNEKNGKIILNIFIKILR